MAKVSLSELRRLWVARDERYSKLKHDLTENEISSVRAYRVSEAEELSPPRPEMVAEAVRWSPPPRVSRG